MYVHKGWFKKNNCCLFAEWNRGGELRFDFVVLGRRPRRAKFSGSLPRP